MGFTYTSIVEAPVEDVFAWHARPGAFSRLSPPWLPSVPLRGLLRWRHTHEFAAYAGSSTRVIDRVETPLGARFLRPIFVYRHRQLADDLAAHRWAAGVGAQPLTIAVTGSSGLVGSALCAFLTSGGHRVVRLVRGQPKGPDDRHWDPLRPDPALLEGIDALVHLAGESIAGRFTPAHKRAIRDSRVEPTRLLSRLAGTTPSGPRVMVAASAIGYYGADRGNQILTETSQPGEGFLAEAVVQWEAATRPAIDAGIRVSNIRTGIVQSPRGGTLRLFRPLFSLGLGGRISTGRQWLSWIDLDDLIDVYNRALFDPVLAGPINAVAPAPVRNADYVRTLGHVLNRPALVPVPSLGPNLILGKEGSRELAEADQNVIPARLQESGHHFRYPDLEDSLRHQLGRAVR
ncbi:MAG TPA: TIGR01777 family oxidoreductase [Micrococcaceae bacterium]|jgi:hypothetical protein|nr:TIGR01777 family oxidoreductase [Micrococcaceae bacterium]